MPGQPQLRESGLLYAPDDPYIAAMVRLEERMDGSGVWVVLLNSPASEQTPKRWERPDEDSARAVLADLYAEGEEKGGRWRITAHTAGQPDPE